MVRATARKDKNESTRPAAQWRASDGSSKPTFLVARSAREFRFQGPLSRKKCPCLVIVSCSQETGPRTHSASESNVSAAQLRHEFPPTLTGFRLFLSSCPLSADTFPLPAKSPHHHLILSVYFQRFFFLPVKHTATDPYHL